MDKKIELTVDGDPWITEDGIEVCVFIGGNDEPTEYHYTWDEIIDKQIECEIILGFDDKTVFLNEDNITELERVAHSLEAGASKIYDLIDNSYLFDRAAWLKANDDVYNQENKEQFLTKVKK
jgi:hypothetical protein